MLPLWVERMVPGCWYQISGNRPDLDLPPTLAGTRYLADNDLAKDKNLNPPKSIKEQFRRWLGRRPFAPWQGRCGFPAITEAWNGAAFASKFGASGSMVVFGGGHNDYFGSDVHAFDLSTRRWSRIFDGYTSGAIHEYGAGAVYPNAIYPNGSPLPPHTYGYVQYDPVKNDYLLLKGQTELGPDVKATPIPHLFNLDTLTWRRGPRHPLAVLGSGGWTTWDASRRTLWGHSGDSGQAFIGFTPDGANRDGTFGSWTPMYGKKILTCADHNTMAIDPRRDIIVIAAWRANSLYVLDPGDPGEKIVRLPVEGSRPLISEFAALEYAPNLDRLVYYSAHDGPEVFAIAPSDGPTRPQPTKCVWRWQSLVRESNRLNPIAHAQSLSSFQVNRNHTFGRFRVATYGAIDVAILVRHVDTPVYAMRLNE